MAATIKDIAKKTNLSITTVSLVLNDKAPKIPETTKQLVLEAARELNYHPNQIAISLLKKKTKTLGLVIPDIRNDFFSTLAKAVEDEAHKKGWTVILCNTNDHHDRDIEYMHLLASKSVDGILFCMAGDTTLKKFNEVNDLLVSLNIPYVMIDRSFDVDGVHTARIDHRLGGFLATEHLLKLGHRRIACITGPPHLRDSADRLLGYKDALDQYGVDFDEALISNGKYQMNGGFNAINHLNATDFTAVFAFNDMMAIGAYKALKKMDRKIPQDCSIVGYDDITFADMLEVPLTTVRQPITKAGKSAVDFLINHLNNQSSPATHLDVFSPTLVIRESSAPPK